MYLREMRQRQKNVCKIMTLLQLILAKNVRYWRLWMCAKCRYSQETLQRGKRAKHKFTPAGDGLAESLSISLRPVPGFSVCSGFFRVNAMQMCWLPQLYAPELSCPTAQQEQRLKLNVCLGVERCARTMCR